MHHWVRGIYVSNNYFTYKKKSISNLWWIHFTSHHNVIPVHPPNHLILSTTRCCHIQCRRMPELSNCFSSQNSWKALRNYVQFHDLRKRHRNNFKISDEYVFVSHHNVIYIYIYMHFCLGGNMLMWIKCMWIHFTINFHSYFSLVKLHISSDG